MEQGNPYRQNGKFTTYTEVTDKMREVIYELVYSGKTEKQICIDADISQTTLYNWRKWQPFVDELTKERQRKFNVMGDKAIDNLMRLMNDDSDKRTQLQAIKLVLGECSLLNDKLEVDIKNHDIKITLDTEEEE